MANFTFIIDLQERVIAPLKKISSSFEKVKGLNQDLNKSIGKLNAPLEKATASTAMFENKTASLNKTFRKVNSTMRLLTGGFVVSKITNFGGAVVDTLVEFERYEAVLTNTLGSNSAAKKALNEITAFAAKTPFHVKEVADAFVGLNNQNFSPTLQQMAQLGDLAASTGHRFDELSNALLSARKMDLESLEKFGVKAKKQGDNIKFLFKEQETIVKANSSAITNYILSLGRFKAVQGSMGSFAKTTGAKLDYLTGRFVQFKLELGHKLKPIIDAVIVKLSNMVQWFRSLVTWVATNQVQIISLGTALKNLIIPFIKLWAVSKILTSISIAINAVRSGVVLLWIKTKLLALIAPIINAITVSFNFLKIALAGARSAMILLNFATLANPIVAIIAAAVAVVGGLAAAVWGLSNIFPQVGEAVKSFYDGVVKWFGKAWDWVYNNFIKPVAEGVKKIGSYLGMVGDVEITPNVKIEGMDKVKELASVYKPFAHLKDVQVPFKLPTQKEKQTKPYHATKKQNDFSPQKKLSSVLGSNKPSNNVIVNIGKLVESMNFHYPSAKGSKEERASDVKEEMIKALLQATNSINHANS